MIKKTKWGCRTNDIFVRVTALFLYIRCRNTLLQSNNLFLGTQIQASLISVEAWIIFAAFLFYSAQIDVFHNCHSVSYDAV